MFLEQTFEQEVMDTLQTLLIHGSKHSAYDSTTIVSTFTHDHCLSLVSVLKLIKVFTLYSLQVGFTKI